MVVYSYVKKNLFGLNKEISLSNSPKYSDVLISSRVKRVRDISRKQKNSLIVFLTKKRYKNIPKNVFVYDKFDFFENVLIYNNIKAFCLNLRERYFYKVKSYLTKNNKLSSIRSILKNLGFLSINFRDYTSFLNYLEKKDYVLEDEKVYFKVVSKNAKNEIFRSPLKQNLAGFFLLRGGRVYFFKYLISPKSIFYKKIFNALLKIVKNFRFFKKTPLQSIGLREKERFFASHIGEGFFIQDSTGKITFVNNILKKMLVNYNIGFSYLEKLFLDKYLSSSIKKERSFNFNFEINNPIEGKHYFEINYSPIKSGGEILSYCAIIRDVTLQKSLEEALYVSNSELERMNRVLKTIQNATILGFSKLAEYKDQETAGHLDRIQNYVRALTKEIYRREIFIDYKTKKNYITEEYIEELSFSSLLHDIGKMGIPDNILQKPTRLTKEEFISMQSHTTIGGDTLKWLNDMVSEKTFLALAKEVAYFHHEKWNGKGYPFSLREEEIPLSARIVGLCDVYDALTSKRSYKESYTHEKACEIIYNHASTQFDPAVISVFSSVEEEFRHIRKTYSE